MNLFEIADASLGRVGGFIVSVLLCVFYTSMATLNMMEIGSFVTAYLIQGTPFIAATLVAALAAAYVLTKGMGALSRLIPAITIISCIVLMANWCQALTVADFNNLLPIFNKPLGSYVHATLFAVAVPYCESMTMFALLPMVEAGADMKKPAITVYLFTALVMMLVHLRETASLGSLMTYTSQPTFEVMRMVDSGIALVRTESLFAIQLITLTFVKVTVIIYALARGIAHVAHFERTSSRNAGHKAILVPVCLFVAIYAATFRGTEYNNIEWYVNIAPIVWMFFEAAVPIVMLAATVLRGRTASKAAVQ
jgi:hypothetical protein